MDQTEIALKNNLMTALTEVEIALHKNASISEKEAREGHDRIATCFKQYIAKRREEESLPANKCKAVVVRTSHSLGLVLYVHGDVLKADIEHRGLGVVLSGFVFCKGLWVWEGTSRLIISDDGEKVVYEGKLRPLTQTEMAAVAKNKNPWGDLNTGEIT